MDRVELMFAERSAQSVALINFMRITSRDKESLICFFEGEDEKYYGVRLNLFLNGAKWHAIHSGGKKSVLNLHKYISSNEYYKTSKVAYFIDRDFDDSLKSEADSCIYETPCYSIENLYCDDESIKNILSAEFGLSEHTGCKEYFSKIFSVINITRDQFHQAVRSLNTYIKAHRIKEESEGGKRLNLQNVDINRIVKISLGSVDVVSHPIEYNKIFESDCDLTDEELASADTFLSENFHYDFRGKYELEFIRILLCKLKEACSSKGHELYRSGFAVKLNMSKANAISELSQYATTPPCLREFLGRVAILG